ncbi:hypothetical protein PCASD_01609 [Puccinia coronata f. sp. avenae]|uniref:ubiquitinyl hydrolase 1 n=1 Tax=Puccinia coronata f. sp. avenae TaxID=200324 RepID=A0A2N5VIG0_9BASI|nr:hypothetical protein PCASD_01609 [Puccinia coronata f. sp. avenae]
MEKSKHKNKQQPGEKLEHTHALVPLETLLEMTRSFTAAHGSNKDHDPIWMALLDLLDEYLPSTYVDQLARFPLLTTFCTILSTYALCSTCLRIQRTTSLPSRLTDSAYGLYELITHTLPFIPLGFSSFSHKIPARNQDANRHNLIYHLSNRSTPSIMRHSTHFNEHALMQHSKEFYPGLINSSSNSCFINAVLQSLASMPHIIQYLDLIQSYDLPSTPVSNALGEMLLALNTPRDHPVVLKTFSVAQALLGNPNARRSMLFNSEQQDAQEFLVTVIDALEAEAKILADQLLLEYQSTQSSGLERDQFWIQAREICKIPFRALMAHRIACGTCGFTSAIRHSFADHFSLNVPPKTTCRLESCLQEYTKLEVLDDYICRKCSLIKTVERLTLQLGEIQQESKTTNNKKKQTQLIKKKLAMLKAAIEEDPERELAPPITLERVASLTTTKQTMFARPPDSLTFHISRSTAYARGVSFKNHCQVTYPEHLTLDPYCTTFDLSGDATQPISRHRGSNDYRYRLSSVVVHFGSHSFGHYITYRRAPSPSTSGSNHTPLPKGDLEKEDRIPDGNGVGEGGDTCTWYRISDENVQVSSIDDALRSNPFLLMYERVFDPDHHGDSRNQLAQSEKVEYPSSYHAERAQNHSLIKPVARELSWFQIS